MIDGLKPYPEYRESGVAWLGEVPAHWDVRRAKYLLRPVDVRSEHGAEELLTVSSARGVVPRRTATVTMFQAASYAGHKLCWPGDLVINSLWAWAGGLGVADHHGIVSTAYGVYRVVSNAQVNPRFLHALVRSGPFHWELRVRSKGVWTSRLQLTDESFLGSSLLVPPQEEQDAIVCFLDHADRRIRRYIRAKQKLIKLLEEQKQVLIGRAVTRGLDPDVRRKPSDIQWLGEIPEHWNVRRVKSELRNLNTHRIPLSATERGRMTLRRYDYYGASGIIDKVDDYLFDGELLLIAEDGANLVLRNLPLAIIARGRFWVNNHAHILKVKRGSLEYFAALLECIEYSPWITGAAQPKLTQDRLMAIHIPVPPEEEQFRIATWVRSNTAEIEATIHRARTEMSLLGELRTRLIAEVVTGKLDVREAAARLPDVLDEEPATEALDEDATSLDGDDADAEALDPELQEA